MNEPYRPERYRTRESRTKLAQDLPPVSRAAWCSPELVFSPEQTGAACLAKPGRQLSAIFAFSRKSRHYHGTGDLFASVFVAAKMKGLEIGRCAQIAADFVKRQPLPVPSATARMSGTA